MCGDEINFKTGFSYDPEILFKNKIFFYNFSWSDMEVPDFRTIFNIVQMIYFTVKKKAKVLVHCHAGMGRTGLVIGCYLIYGENYSSQKAIELVKIKRREAFNTAAQVSFIKQFQQCVEELRIIFPSNSSEKICLSDLLYLQSFLIHGEERKLLKNCPKIIFESIKRIINLISESRITAEQVSMI